MQNFVKISFVVALAAIADIIFPAHAIGEDEKDWNVAVDLTLNSRYVSRGSIYVDDLVFQPSLILSYRWFNVGVWASEESTNNIHHAGHGDTAGDFTEIDYFADLFFNFGPVELTAGAAVYTFPNTDFNQTTEVYVSAGPDILLAPAVIVYYDVEDVYGLYYNFSLSHSMEIMGPVSMDLRVEVGYGDERHNEYYYGLNETVFTDAQLSVAFPVGIGKFFTITPAGYYTAILDEDLRDVLDDTDIFWYGISVACEF